MNNTLPLTTQKSVREVRRMVSTPAGSKTAARRLDRRSARRELAAVEDYDEYFPTVRQLTSYDVS